MLQLTDPASGALVPLTPSGGVLSIAAGAQDLGTLFATDTLRRTAEVCGLRVQVSGVPQGLEVLGIRGEDSPGPPDVVVVRPWEAGDPPYGPEHRLAWLTGTAVAAAIVELAEWRQLVAEWAEHPSKPMCAQVQEDLLAALCDDLATARAVEVLRGSLSMGLPPGCLFETWAWADRLLAVDLAAHVGR